MAVYTIDITKLKDIESKIKSEQESFEKVNSNYAASYVKTCSHTTINNMAKKLDDLFSKISTGYTNILSWYNDYISNAEGVENALAENGSSSISNGAISAEASKMSELETADLNITGTFTAVVEMDDVSIDPSKLDPESLAVYEDTLAQLTALGFTKSEVDQVLLGYKTLEEIEQEILKNDERRQKYYELLALSPYGYSSITELDQNIATLQATLSTLENKYLAASEGDILAAFLYKLELPLSGFVADDEDAVWSYRNKNGELCFSGTNPVSTQGAGVSEVQGYSYNDLCLLFPESALLQEMKTVFGDTSNGILGLGATKSGFSWSKGKDNKDYLNRVDAYQKSLQGQKEELATQIASTKQQLDELNAIKVEVTEQLDYALNSIQNYTYNDDFTLFCGFSFNDKQNLDAFFEQVKEKTNTVMTSEYYEANYRPASEEDLATILFAYFNGYGNVTFNGYEMQINNTRVLSNDLMFENYGEWASALSETEKNVYNYIYKTEGAKAAYEWLDRIDTEVDERYIKGNLNYTLTEEQLAKFDEIYQASGVDEACKYAESISPDVVVGKTVKDQLWANESTLNQILASVGSVVITPFEGMGAMFNNANALLTGQEIYYSDIYSKGNVYRGSVSEYIREHGNGFWSFMYDTGMSIADSAAMIGLNAATGGTLSWALAPTMMGSRVYVSAVNDGKDRGLSDLESVLWGLSSAAVESLAEHWSLGKLTGLSQQADKILPKIVGKFSTFSNNPTINKVATRFFTAAYTSLRQGFSEGSEEAVTEIMNGFVDFFLIGKDKSNIMLTINAYEENGSTPEEAIKLALKDFGSDVFMAWLGGFVSGEVYGAPQGIKASSNYSKYVVSSKIAQAIVNDYNANAPANLQVDSYTDFVERQVAVQTAYENAVAEAQEKANSLTHKIMTLLSGVKASSEATTTSGAQVEYLGAEAAATGSSKDSSKTITNDETITIPLLEKIKEAGEFGANKEVDVHGTLEQLLATGLDMKSIPSGVFLKVVDEYGAHDIFFPTSLKEYNEIVASMKKHPEKYSSKIGNSLCYDFKTGKVEDFEMMRYRLERYSEIAEEVLVNMTKGIARQATDPHLKGLTRFVENIKNLSSQWSVIYNASGSVCQRLENIINLDEYVVGNEERGETMFHELGHSFHNAVNGARVPVDYVTHLFKAIEHFRNHSSSISSFFANLATEYEQVENECKEIFERDYAQKLRDTIFSRRDALAAYYASYGLDLSKLDATLEKQYEDAKKQKLNDLFEDRYRKSGLQIIQGIITDMFFIPAGETVTYVDGDGKLVTLDHLDYGHSDEYNKRFRIMETSFHELMAEFNELKLSDARNGTNYASVFIEVFGQDFYDYMYNFWGETVDCLCTGGGRQHQYESLSESDLALLSTYLKSFGNMVNAPVIENISDITEINLNKNNIALTEDGEYNLSNLLEKLTLADQVKLKIDISDMSDADIRDLTILIYSNEVENIGNIEYVKDGKVVPIGEAILTKADFKEKSGKYWKICHYLEKIAGKAKVTVDLTGFTDSEILELGAAIYNHPNSINMDNINFVLEDGSPFTFTKILINESIASFGTPGVTEYVGAIRSALGKVQMIFDVSTMRASEFQSLLSRLALLQVRIGTITFLYNDGYSTKMYPPQQYQKLIEDMQKNQRLDPVKPKEHDARYDNVELIPPKQQDIADSAPTLAKAFRDNLVDGAKRGVQLKQDLLASVQGLTSESEIIRTLYMELSKKVHYDMNYVVGSDAYRNAVANSEILTFDTLNEAGLLVCKGWSELYREILIAAGIDPARVEVKGRLHRWVEIDMGDGNIIIADATQVVEGFPADDLATTKVGMPTCGFMILNKGYSGYNPRQIYELLDDTNYTEKQRQGFAKAIAASDKSVLSIDKKLRYASPQGYYADQLTQAKKLFGDGKLAKLFGHKVNPEQVKIDTINKLINMDLSTMSGDEVYVYMHHIMEKVFGDEADGPYLAYHKTKYGAEAVAIVNLQEGAHGRYLIYSEALGKQIINAQDLTKFMNDNAILYKKQYKSAYIDPPPTHKRNGTREIPKVHNTEQLPKVDPDEDLDRTEELFPAEGGN